MPKTSTGNKRASSASTKKSGLKRRFDLTNRKVQFFVVIAIVAVLGGGYFTVRSFAMTNLYTIHASSMSCSSCTPVNEVQKNGKKVWQLNNVGGRTSLANTPQFYIAADGNYELCVTGQGFGNLEIRGGTPSNSYGGALFNENKTNAYINFSAMSYSQKCVKYIPKQGNNILTFTTPFSGSNVYLSQIAINRTTPTPTAPAPPAK